MAEKLGQRERCRACLLLEREDETLKSLSVDSGKVADGKERDSMVIIYQLFSTDRGRRVAQPQPQARSLTRGPCARKPHQALAGYIGGTIDCLDIEDNGRCPCGTTLIDSIRQYAQTLLIMLCRVVLVSLHLHYNGRRRSQATKCGDNDAKLAGLPSSLVMVQA